jgi:transcriptional/translational regulatory protein YebC/TACO1
VKDALVSVGLGPAATEVAMIPQNYSELDVEIGEKVLRLVDALEDLDDVTCVFTNAKFPEELMD